MVVKTLQCDVKNKEDKKQRIRENRKKLLMAEDFLNNIHVRVKDVAQFCNVDDIDFLLPGEDTQNDKVNTYQQILLYLEIISQHIENMSSENQKLIEKSATLKNDLDVMQNRSNKLDNIIEKMQGDYRFLNNKYEVTNKNLCKKNEKLKQMTRQCENTEKLFTDNLSLKEENNRLKLSLEDIENDYEQEKASLEEVIKISDENLYLNNKIDVLDDENKNLKEEVKTLQLNTSKLNEISFKNKSLENLVQKMKHTIKKKSKELHGKDYELSILKEKVNNEVKKCECENLEYEESIINYNMRKSNVQTTYIKNMSTSFITSLREVYNKMEDIDKFIYDMLEKENRSSNNVFRNE